MLIRDKRILFLCLSFFVTLIATSSIVRADSQNGNNNSMGNRTVMERVIDSNNTNTTNLSKKVTGAVYTPSDNAEGDKFKGGTITLDSKFSVPGTEVAYNAFLKYHVAFKLKWQIPDQIPAHKFIEAIDTGKSKIFLGDHEVPISSDKFKILNDKEVEYSLSDDSFDLFSLIRYLWSLVFGKGTAEIYSSISLDVNKLSQDFPKDFSKNRPVTQNKLLPDIGNKLMFTVSLYNRNSQFLMQTLLALNTWSNYISPWNAKEASSDINGKDDDTQSDASTEVIGTNRVLRGIDYKNRVIELPITESINPNNYVRVVNFFTKRTVPNFPINIDAPIVKNERSEDGDTAYLKRYSKYYYRGSDPDVLVSPVSIEFIQKTYLTLKVKNIKQQYQEKEQIPVNCEIDTQGTNSDYYFSIDHGKQNVLENHATESNKLKSYISGLNIGHHIITIGVKNEFGLSKEVSFEVNILKGSLCLEKVPESVDFGKIKLSPDKIIKKGKVIGDLIVVDNRTNVQNKAWKVSLKETKRINTDGVFISYINREGKTILINEQNQSIENSLSTEPSEDRISDDWTKVDHGIFINVPLSAQKIGNYVGQLTWTLENIPRAS